MPKIYKMAVFLQKGNHMKTKSLIAILTISGAIIVVSCKSIGNKLNYIDSSVRLPKIHNLVYFNPEVYPNIEEIGEPTNTTFFSTVTNELNRMGNYKVLRINTFQKFDSVNPEMIKEYCQNNNAEVAVVSKVKYFKVGIGKYVFSNQVLIGLKLFNSEGKLVAETSYDTYKANARILGSAENSIKIGTLGAMKRMTKELRDRNMLYRKIFPKL